jgi:hypothetical protein
MPSHYIPMPRTWGNGLPVTDRGSASRPPGGWQAPRRSISSSSLEPNRLEISLDLFGIPISISTGGGQDVIPTTATSPSGTPVCLPPWFRNPISGACELGVAPGGVGPLGQDPRPPHGGLHALTVPHTDTVPERREISVRRCQKGSVLGKDGWCHPKGTIANKQREWPKPRRPLGTSGELAAVSKASRFGKRLKLQEKRLKRLGRDLGVTAKRGR